MLTFSGNIYLVHTPAAAAGQLSSIDRLPTRAREEIHASRGDLVVPRKSRGFVTTIVLCNLNLYLSSNEQYLCPSRLQYFRQHSIMSINSFNTVGRFEVLEALFQGQENS